MESVTCNRCGSVDDYHTEQSGKHIKAICNNCKRYIKFLPQYNPVTVLPFGKHKDKDLSTLTSKEDIEYLRWCVDNLKLSASIKSSIVTHLNTIGV